jgi:hypothetical protein
MPQLQINQGPQDALLYDNTRSYFTNVGYVRTSNFQMELRDVPAVNNAAFGSSVSYIIPKSADLLGPVDLIVDLAQAVTPTGVQNGNYAAWVESLGYAMIDEMSFNIGSHQVEKISGDQMNIMNELMKGDTQRQGKLIGKTGRSGITLDVNETAIGTAASTYTPNQQNASRIITSETYGMPAKKLVIPLNFFFTKHPSQYFPLCAIAGCNDVRITIKFRSLNELMIIGRHNYKTTSTSAEETTAVIDVTTAPYSTSDAIAAAAAVGDIPAVAAVPAQTIASPVPTWVNSAMAKAELRCHYVHVTGPEATTLMNKEHVRLLKLWHHQPQTFKVAHTDQGKAAKFDIDLGFLHPVQELIITVRKTGNMTSSTEVGGAPNAVDQGATCKNYFAYEGNGVDPNIESHLNKIKLHGTHQATSATTANTLRVDSFQLSLNGQERHPSLAGKGIDRGYLMDRLMPMLHSNTSETFTQAGVTDAGHDASATFSHLGEMLDRKEIYVYPFALNPEGANPSGAVNFSKVSHAKLTIDYTAFQGAAGADEEYVVDVYGVYFNWLQIKDGRALTSFQ